MENVNRRIRVRGIYPLSSLFTGDFHRAMKLNIDDIINKFTVKHGYQ